MMRIAAAGLIVGCIVVGLVAVMTATPEKAKRELNVALRPMIVYEAEPSTPIKHSVELKNAIYSVRHETLLVGPKRYATETNLKADATEAILFAWYDLPEVDREVTPKTVDLLSGDGTQKKFTVGEARFFLSTTQRLQEGTPAEPPKGLSHFVAFRVLDAEEESRPIELQTADGPATFTLKRPAFVCLATQEWHHDEHFRVTDASSGWIVYEIEPIPNNGSVSTLDQFGFNTLSLGTANWLCLPSSLRAIK